MTTGSERTWKIEQPMSFTVEQLENIADGLESGDIEPGAFTLSLPIGHGLPPELLARLMPVLGRVHGTMRVE